jgi:hypothetical protein
MDIQDDYYTFRMLSPIDDAIAVVARLSYLMVLPIAET